MWYQLHEYGVYHDEEVKEILTNDNLQNYMIHYLARKTYDHADK
ncbi:hypothetical protein P8V03_15285 [Clostridium sp. A1-XYC3]|uniref:Uncharacterized protein n=1 Tax=Clostridium tanneri TaxID=3037988 RepID=A0ABU4JWI7_9CLOT|nr:hypothetical protein [Clostridium sp. A1-XYC3]MDW8802510.1 hypothetical protein [Clostridium sp. A1-XYC3]